MSAQFDWRLRHDARDVGLIERFPRRQADSVQGLCRSSRRGNRVIAADPQLAADLYSEASATKVPTAMMLGPAKVRRSMPLKVIVFGHMPSLDVKLIPKDQDLSFQRGPRPQHVGDASPPVELRQLNAISPGSNQQTAARSPTGSSSRSPCGSAHAAKTDRMHRYGPDGR